MSYQNYGIPRSLVEKVKAKMKQPALKNRVMALLDGVTREDLQNRAKVRSLLRQASAVLSIPMDQAMQDRIVRFVIDQKIDPNNTFHLIRLWNMFR